MPFPQNTNLIFVYNNKPIHKESLSFETSGFGHKVMEDYLYKMKVLEQEQLGQEMDPSQIIKADEIVVYIDEDGVKRKVN